MIDNQPVLTIHRGHLRPAPALVAAFCGAMTSHLTDAMRSLRREPRLYCPH